MDWGSGIGGSSGASGTVTVTDAGSNFTCQQDFAVGLDGTGTFIQTGGMTIIGGALASTRRAGIMSGELLDNENLAVLEQRQAELKSELDTRRRRSIGIMLQAEMKV